MNFNPMETLFKGGLLNANLKKKNPFLTGLLLHISI